MKQRNKIAGNRVRVFLAAAARRFAAPPPSPRPDGTRYRREIYTARTVNPRARANARSRRRKRDRCIRGSANTLAGIELILTDVPVNMIARVCILQQQQQQQRARARAAR